MKREQRSEKEGDQGECNTIGEAGCNEGTFPVQSTGREAESMVEGLVMLCHLSYEHKTKEASVCVMGSVKESDRLR